MPIIGEINKLRVIRETDIGFMLDANDQEIFLHKNESNYQDLKPGDLVSAFLYFDQKGRLAATLKEPLITVSKDELLEVVDILPNLGVFLDMGINKDLLLSKDDLPYNKGEWPQVGEKLFVKLVVKGKLVAKFIDLNELPDGNLEIGQELDFHVQRVGEYGLNLVNEEHAKVFVHETQLRGAYRLGEIVNVKILSHTEKGFTGSLIKQKELLRFDDADEIMNYLTRYKKMNLTAKSSSEDIAQHFDMSRKAFKRALGLLYKERKVIFTDSETLLVDGDKDE